jgi:hypothetical protein
MTVGDRRQRVAAMMEAMKEAVLSEFPYVDEKFVGSISFTFNIQTGSISGQPEITKRGRSIRIDSAG